MTPDRKFLVSSIFIAFAIAPLDSMMSTSLQLRNRLEPSPGPNMEDPKQIRKKVLLLNSCFSGQRCAGRNFNGKRCCTPQEPCGFGEGDCDGPGDGGGNDGHAGCRGELVCGSNNCRKFGLFYHEKDDCCDLPDTLRSVSQAPVQLNGAPLEPRRGVESTAFLDVQTHRFQFQVKDAPEGISMAGDAALHRTLVTRERVTVMAPGTAARMTDTEAARETWSVAPTIV